MNLLAVEAYQNAGRG